MVGVVALKNFQTGSYRYMRISIFKGNSYSDIEKGELVSSYSADPDSKLAVLEHSNDINEFVSLDKIIYVSRSAREYFYENTYATQLKFKTNGEDISFKISSAKCGVSEPASFRELFDDKGLYMLVSDEKESTYMWRSALCDALNFAVQSIFDVSQEIYAQSGGGIYINLALFSPRVVKDCVKDIDPDVFKRLKSIKKQRIGCLKSVCSYTGEAPRMDGFGYRIESIYLYRRLKHEACVRVLDGFCSFNHKETLLYLLSLPLKISLRECADRFTKDIEDCITSCFKYSNIITQSYKDIITAREFLSLAHVSNRDISGILSARSSNLKFLKPLPCAKYLLSDGAAYWESGKEKIYED